MHFTDDSMIRVVHRERAVGLGGGRALLMMAAEPITFEGFFASTDALGSPYERLRRTGVVMDTITFGSAAQADRMTARVRSMHDASSGTLPEAAGPHPAGTPYRANDPELLRWVLVCLMDSCVLAYERYVRGLSTEQRDGYAADYQLVGELFGIPRSSMPRDWADLREYVDGMLASDRLHVTPRARELGRQIVMNPPIPLWARPLVELLNQVTIGLLPGSIRRGYGFWWDPARAVALRTNAEVVRRTLVPLLPDGLRLVPSAAAIARAA